MTAASHQMTGTTRPRPGTRGAQTLHVYRAAHLRVSSGANPCRLAAASRRRIVSGDAWRIGRHGERCGAEPVGILTTVLLPVAADEAGGGVGDALADALAVTVAGGVGQLVDQIRGHQALEQADHRDRHRIGQDDPQRLKGERDVGNEEHRQRVGQRAHVAHAAHVDPELLLVDEVLAVGDASWRDYEATALFRDAGLDWDWSVPLYGQLLSVTGGKERIRHYLDRYNPAFPRPADLASFITGLHKAKPRHYMALMAEGAIPLRPGVERLLRAARAASWRLGIATTTTPENVSALLDSTLPPGAMDWFEVVGAGDIGETGFDVVFTDQFGFVLSQGHHAGGSGLHAPHEEQPDTDDEDPRKKADQRLRPHRVLLFEGDVLAA